MLTYINYTMRQFYKSYILYIVLYGECAVTSELKILQNFVVTFQCAVVSMLSLENNDEIASLKKDVSDYVYRIWQMMRIEIV